MSAQAAIDTDELDAHEFIRGSSDCAQGLPHKAGQGEGYDKGYSTQYQHQQIMDAKTS